MVKSRFLIVFSVLLFALWANAQKPATVNSFTIDGELSSLKGDVTITLSYRVSDGDSKIDTVIAKNGRFTFRGILEDPSKARLSYISDEEVEFNGTKGYMMDAVNFYLSAGTTTVKGEKLKNAEVKGNPVQEDYNGYLLSIAGLEQEKENLYKKFSQVQETNVALPEDLVKAKERIPQIRKEIDAVTVNFVSSHPDSYLSLTFLYDLRNKDLAVPEIYRLAGLLSDRIKAMDEWKVLYEKLDAARKTAEGAKYIDFTKKDINGNNFTLSSIKGKYVILDFWGSWCGPCRMSHPHLKEVYEKYKSKGLDIVGIANEKSKDMVKCEESWKKAVKEDGMTWTQLLNNYDLDKTDLVKLYGIQAFPTKILLDKEGRVFYRIVGGDPNLLDEKLKELIGE